MQRIDKNTVVLVTAVYSAEIISGTCPCETIKEISYYYVKRDKPSERRFYNGIRSW